MNDDYLKKILLMLIGIKSMKKIIGIPKWTLIYLKKEKLFTIYTEGLYNNPPKISDQINLT